MRSNFLAEGTVLMKRDFLAVVLMSLLPMSQLTATAETAPSDGSITAPESRVSLYAVPLRCPLVEGLGCGSMAKPFLTDLERNSSVAEAWIDHSGTRLAVVWKPDARGNAKAAALEAASRTTKLTELSGDARETALREIRSHTRWYRAADVDQLSREEAETVAARLLDIVNAAEPLPQAKREMLMTSFSEIFKRKFIGGELSDKQAYEELLETARPHLGATGFQVLDKTIREKCCAPAQ